MFNKILCHQIFLEFLCMICLAINFHLAMKKLFILALKFDYFAISQYRDLHLKEFNMVEKWS